jgi:hypothetical protein
MAGGYKTGGGRDAGDRKSECPAKGRYPALLSLLMTASPSLRQ